MLKQINPSSVVKPFSRYSQAVEAPGDYRWLHISGQVGATPDGAIVKGFDAQADQCWKNILAILKDAGMTVNDLVKVNIFVTGKDVVARSRTIRDAALQGAQPASTYLVVAGLAHPDLEIEIEAIAARAA